MKTRMTIQIAGQEYTMVAEETQEYMSQVAEYALQSLISCGGSQKAATTRSLALALINLSDDYMKANMALEAEKERCIALEAQCGALKQRPQKQPKQNAKNKKKK